MVLITSFRHLPGSIQAAAISCQLPTVDLLYLVQLLHALLAVRVCLLHLLLMCIALLLSGRLLLLLLHSQHGLSISCRSCLCGCMLLVCVLSVACGPFWLHEPI
jgi:hypothetical protein